jgi:hypothetical protein
MERKAGTNLAQSHGLESKKKSGHRRAIFLDFPSPETPGPRLLSCWNLDEVESKLGRFRLEVFDL